MGVVGRVRVAITRRAERRLAANALQRPLLRRSRFRAHLKAGVRRTAMEASTGRADSGREVRSDQDKGCVAERAAGHAGPHANESGGRVAWPQGRRLGSREPALGELVYQVRHAASQRDKGTQHSRTNLMRQVEVSNN